MKTFKFLAIFFIASLMTSGLSANAYNAGDPDGITNEQLRKEIVQLIAAPVLIDAEEKMEITFMVTKKMEIVVLNVDTDESYLDDYIKNSLNYETIATKGVLVNTPYRVKVTFQQ